MAVFVELFDELCYCIAILAIVAKVTAWFRSLEIGRSIRTVGKSVRSPPGTTLLGIQDRGYELCERREGSSCYQQLGLCLQATAGAVVAVKENTPREGSVLPHPSP